MFDLNTFLKLEKLRNLPLTRMKMLANCYDLVRLKMVILKCPFTYTNIRFTVHKMYEKFYLNYQPAKSTATFFVLNSF